MSRQRIREFFSNFHYGWVIVFACGLVLTTTFMYTQPIGLYTVPVTKEIGISQGKYSLSRTYSSIMITFFYAAYVPLQKKFGTKNLILISLCCEILAALIFSWSNSMIMIFFAATFNSAMDPLSGQISIGNIINNWFHKHNALALSLIFSFANLGTFLSTKLLAHWIVQVGWRKSLQYQAIICGIVLFFVSIVMRDTPEEMGLNPYKDNNTSTYETKEIEKNKEVAPISEKVHWTLLLWGLISGVVTYPLANFVPSMLTNAGFSIQFSGSAMGIINIGSFLLLPFLGACVDAFGVRIAALICCVTYYFSLWGFFSLEVISLRLALITCLMLGVANILFPLMPFLIRERYGTHNYSQRMSQAIIFRSIGSAVGYPLLGFFYDMSGNYFIPLVIFSFLSIGLLALSFVVTNPIKNRLKAKKRRSHYEIYKKIR